MSPLQQAVKAFIEADTPFDVEIADEDLHKAYAQSLLPQRKVLEVGDRIVADGQHFFIACIRAVPPQGEVMVEVSAYWPPRWWQFIARPKLFCYNEVEKVDA